jgi:DNA polymerase III delta subunit
MPKLELKQVQRDLEKGTLWPVYWVYGPERMKSREILKRIRKAVLGEEAPGAPGTGGGLFGGSLAEETLDGSQVSAIEVVDSAQTLALGGGLRFIVVREAHQLDEPEALAPLLGPSARKEALTSVCVFLSKDLDGRKKFSKILLEQAAVVECEQVPDADREAWIDYLANARGLAPSESERSHLKAQLCAIDPWTLDIVDLELDKWEQARASGLSGEEAHGVLQAAAGAGSEAFVEAFLARSGLQAMESAAGFAAQPESALPLLGLLSWNVRQLIQMVAARDGVSRAQVRMGAFIQERLNRYARVWELDELISLQSALFELDFSIKQTPRLPLGAWSSLVMEFCPLEKIRSTGVEEV